MINFQRIILRANTAFNLISQFNNFQVYRSNIKVTVSPGNLHTKIAATLSFWGQEENQQELPARKKRAPYDGPSCFELDQYGNDCIFIASDSSCTGKQQKHGFIK